MINIGYLLGVFSLIMGIGLAGIGVIKLLPARIVDKIKNYHNE